MAVAAARGGAHRDEHRVRRSHGSSQVGGEGQAALAHVRGHKLGQARLVDRHAALRERLDLGRVDVDAAHVVPEIRKARPGHQSNVPRSNHRYTHDAISNLKEGSQLSLYRKGSGRRHGASMAKTGTTANII